MIILITGVNGFIGKNLTNYLLQRKDCKIIGLTKSNPEFSHPDYFHVQADITNPSFISKLPDNIEIIIHLAQSKLYRDFPNGAADMYSVNVHSTFHLLEWARIHNISRFIFTSTGNVYRRHERPLKESDVTEPASFYGTTKLIAEQLIQSYTSFFQIFILRLFTVFGPGQKNMLVSNIIESIRKGHPVNLASGKGIYINPIYISDLISIFNSLICRNANLPAEIFNIAGDQTVSLIEIVEMIERKTGQKAKTVITDSVPTFLVGDISLIKSTLDKSEFHSVANGLINMLKNYE